MLNFLVFLLANEFYLLKLYRKSVTLTSRWCDLTTSPVSGGWASERRSTSVLGRRAVRAARLLFRGQSHSRINELSSSDSTWVKDVATLGLFTLRTWARMMEGGDRLVFTVTSWQRRGLRGNAHRDFRRTLWLNIFIISFIYLILSFSPPACVGDTEMFAEVLCVAVALVLYVNTLGADFCYDDRYLDEWVASRHMLLSSAPNKWPLDTWIRHNSGYSSCFLNSRWTKLIRLSILLSEVNLFIAIIGS